MFRDLIKKIKFVIITIIYTILKDYCTMYLIYKIYNFVIVDNLE